VLAARYGRLFQCDPMTFLDLPAHDIEIAIALCEAAISDINADGGR
jgi:hypothetical protein